MQFSYDWLQKWVSPNKSADELAHLLTMSGLEVEEVEPAAPEFSGVVIAEVKQVEKHPDADRLNITQVDAGTGELIQIVCGAPNVKVGIKVPCSLPGAVLPGNFKIKPTKMRGQVSNGMLCSGKELGIPDDVDGLMVLPADAPVGADIRDYLALNDALFTLKITPNRADCLGIKGIAREVVALTQCEHNAFSIPTVPVSTGRMQAVRIDAPADCGRFLARVIEGVDAKAATPSWMVQRLNRSGIRSISALVDIGNYVMLELGQPMHIFDADKVTGSIIVRRAEDGEKLLCLNDKEVVLAADTLVVADEAGALSMAGLMGGAASAVSDDTVNVVLESAWFQPNSIANKSRQYGFGSDSSYRYERGVDYRLQADAIERAAFLVHSICGGQVGAVTEALGYLPVANKVAVRTARINQVLGIEVPVDTVATILNHLGLNPVATAEGFEVTAPSFRFDIEQEVDIIEEVGRVYGYDKIPDDYTSGRLHMLKRPENRKTRFSVYHALAARGYREIVSYAFVDETWEQDFAANTNPIRLQNPLASHMSVMRSTLIGGLIKTLQHNLNYKQSRVRLFEIARVFKKDAQGAFVQNERVGGLAYGYAVPEQWGEASRLVDFFDVKGDLEQLIHRSLSVQYQAFEHPAFHPGRCAQLLLDGVVVGVIGQLHPQWVHKYDLPQAPVLFEVELSLLLQSQAVTYQAVSKFPPVRRDLAFVIADSVKAADLLHTLRAAAGPLVKSVDLFDVYTGVGIEAGHKSMALKVMLQDAAATLIDAVVDEEMQSLIKIAQESGATLRA
ncbi:phenylalanine--tRNA ligase subunit beta [Vitreoscilla massiliensis]|uniref:Phenylalanine--tRNA ligase beta subunit n=1 Tax=Vitreoscilla massiliensis TaxID=1689272 RepID=A0ABY4E2N2_9NEIS|nr:phenylalanine--tRNA ligase subunit beta [Vitreoscilla massiliensis]UOO88578.1 phenylalanine--tRNA ligase subunit beta [Vitreoscilla massiliensis]